MAHLRLSSASIAIPRHCWALLKFCTPMLDASPLQQHACTASGRSNASHAGSVSCQQCDCRASDQQGVHHAFREPSKSNPAEQLAGHPVTRTCTSFLVAPVPERGLLAAKQHAALTAPPKGRHHKQKDCCRQLCPPEELYHPQDEKHVWRKLMNCALLQRAVGVKRICTAATEGN